MFRFFRKKEKASPAAAAIDVEADDDAHAFAQADALQEGMATAPNQAPDLEAPDLEAPDLEALVSTLESTAPPSSIAQVSAAEPQKPRVGWLARLRGGLRKTGTSLSRVFGGVRVDDALYEELESALLMADAGVEATESLLAELKRRVRHAGASEPAAVRELLVDVLASHLRPLERDFEVGRHSPMVIMVAGVNGAGKTTSIGKLTRHLADAGCKVLLAAADTFRAAAKEQLAVWADRNQVQIVSQEGGDPAAVAFDAVTAGRARGCDVVIVDTAGRLATQAHLMEELRKIRRTIEKACPGAPHEVLLVVDGHTGQNALAQAKAFDAAIDITGLVVTKLDGTAKGGVLAAMARWSTERRLAKPQARPVAAYFIGVGEALEDLERFDAREFSRALLGDSVD